ncbi:hypothetical protein O9H85_28110 [Paenibacillus filicis]|uniref:TfoX N-terminal domain-containing protein n=1 Tax=Paenibacillus gyeongsangnamensis TaxID=3388067 RepID=A0ABT4QH44_9BACL|nr:hypothetical protein [Paenibacillus filicis]MCZ8516189.1 hypothetical protein [Paenibacillus filicis]
MNPLDRYQEVGQAVAEKETGFGQMFGKPCIQLEGKAFAVFFQEAMVFKLTGEAHLQALQLEGAKLWDPSGKKRPMKDWVQVPFAHEQAWPAFAAIALKQCRTALQRQA